jgi:hypothetical protein
MMARKKSTQDTFDENVKKLAKSAPKKIAAKPKPKEKLKAKALPTIPNHLTNVKGLEEHSPDPKHYSIYPYYKEKMNHGDRSTYYVGSILYRSLADMEKRISFYLDNTPKSSKKDLKDLLIKDLEGIKKRIKAL